MRVLKKCMFVFLPVLCLCLASGQASSEAASRQEKIERISAVNCPAVRLSHWQNSSEQERFAFLFGLVTMLEVEREWQGSKPLPVNRSTVGTWSRGLAGVTLKAMDTALAEYIAANPDKLDMPVVEALGRIYVRPEMSDSELALARSRYAEMQGGKKAGKSGK